MMFQVFWLLAAVQKECGGVGMGISRGWRCKVLSGDMGAPGEDMVGRDEPGWKAQRT